jgi:molybdopterin molybdotransferase
MVTVAEAEQIILTQAKDYGTEYIPFDKAISRVLAEDIKADRDLPPCNRVTMDGIAINYTAFENGARSFNIKGTIAAGDIPIEIENNGQCVEIMTGAALPDSTDTVIRYEDVDIKNGIATVITEAIKNGQNLHQKGKDKKQGELVVEANQYIDAAVISMAASVGKD